MNSLALAEQRWGGERQNGEGGRRRLFDELYRRYEGDLRRYAYWLSGDRHVAEDLLQEALLRAWKSLHRLQEPKAAKGWLMTILRRENARRFERIRPLLADVPMEQLSARDSGYDTSTEAFTLRRALEQLPQEYREPLLKQVIEGYSQKEIAAQIGLTAAGVGTRLFRARQKLRRALTA
ncbi:MAG TPA: sigma-70 family RNA polymerase sigma factor [Sedimenticola thiotaurini]|uniref:Sigma-70 family RNA polymerase sigma factor n=1 Tax=Sedimenticola thiotaurini TaxID=1543721 RepID=A0A831RRD0_9GAMM|nr:sigma-70 family RNA polymerase sigma factor [Sedimenticola thiotaurini]